MFEYRKIENSAVYKNILKTIKNKSWRLKLKSKSEKKNKTGVCNANINRKIFFASF